MMYYKFCVTIRRRPNEPLIVKYFTDFNKAIKWYNFCGDVYEKTFESITHNIIVNYNDADMDNYEDISFDDFESDLK